MGTSMSVLVWARRVYMGKPRLFLQLPRLPGTYQVVQRSLV